MNNLVRKPLLDVLKSSDMTKRRSFTNFSIVSQVRDHERRIFGA